MDIKAAAYTLSPANSQGANQGRPLEAVAQQREAADTFTERKEAAAADQNLTTPKSDAGPDKGKQVDISA